MITSTTASKFPQDYQDHILAMMKERGLDDEHRENVIQEFWHPLTPEQAKAKFREAYESGVKFSDFLAQFKTPPVVTE